MKIEKNYINDFFDNLLDSGAFPTKSSKVDVSMMLMESRARQILSQESGYSELYIDPNVDIVNSNPQVIQQVHDEIYHFLNLLVDNECKNILQIGLGHFASTHFVLSLLMDSICTIEYDDLHIQRYADEINSKKETLICGDSASKEVIEEASKFGPFDCVFIDGNHTYEYVKKDLENYSPLVRKGGIVALHDANFQGDQYGTPQVIKEKEQDYSWEYISYSDEVGIAYFIKV